MRISKSMVKRFVKTKFGMNMDDAAAEKMAQALEEKMSKVAKHAVLNAKSNNRKRVISDDIESYRLKSGD
ncbi:DUF1931 family protein [Candidatus Marsarchaeota archaeon]|nr:DUF1931 family protein [Candidatus Marsarchaeota archaeon]MCL5404760.1 DUF1931 family protein [Candidatus Marsarchaeota archaeon]